ncbi:hypothetical protein E2C01_099272 [Portunus trituberculatus]|uniref:Uncharacterized protein n=1 Tax=Portunus trituberculatus TaxID=210409 RepID=A0A5B7K975_PORTR|nr:hypothetical protein [Portunus trituberculatus]
MVPSPLTEQMHDNLGMTQHLFSLSLGETLSCSELMQILEGIFEGLSDVTMIEQYDDRNLKL